MKKLSALLIPALLILFSTVSAQDLPVDPSTKKVTWFEVVDVPDASAEVLFKRFQSWNTDKNNVVTNDPEKLEYAIETSFPVEYPAPMKGLSHKGNVNYKVQLFAKEGRFKYVLTDFNHTSSRGDGGKLSNEAPECGKYYLTTGGWKTIKKSTAEEVENIIEDIKAGMANPPSNSATSNDW